MKTTEQTLRDILTRRIVILDGAYGSLLQAERLGEAEYRGERFTDHPTPILGNHDVLSITRPDMVARCHRAYLEAGADIIKTNSFTATSISQADYGLQDAADEMNLAAARIARTVADEFTDKPCFVAGVLGPTNRTASLSPDVNDPGFRNVSYDDLCASYRAAAENLLTGGADLILLETIFDTLNAKAAIYALRSLFADGTDEVPLIISGTITDASGRTLSGQTCEAFWYSIAHAAPLAVGLNCALGADQLREYVETLAKIADTNVSVHPNAGLPNEFGEYDETPESMADKLAGFADSGLVNIVGGCCGTTPAHVAAIARRLEQKSPRQGAAQPSQGRLRTVQFPA